MEGWLGDARKHDEFAALADRAVVAYNERFWDEALGAYSDWIDVTERRRSYLFTWHNFVAIEAGIASPQQAAQIMRAVDAQRAAAAAKFNLSLAQLWCTPSNFVPLTPDDNLYCLCAPARGSAEGAWPRERGRMGQALAG